MKVLGVLFFVAACWIWIAQAAPASLSVEKIEYLTNKTLEAFPQAEREAVEAAWARLFSGGSPMDSEVNLETSFHLSEFFVKLEDFLSNDEARVLAERITEQELGGPGPATIYYSEPEYYSQFRKRVNSWLRFRAQALAEFQNPKLNKAIAPAFFAQGRILSLMAELNVTYVKWRNTEIALQALERLRQLLANDFVDPFDRAPLLRENSARLRQMTKSFRKLCAETQQLESLSNSAGAPMAMRFVPRYSRPLVDLVFAADKSPQEIAKLLKEGVSDRAARDFARAKFRLKLLPREQEPILRLSPNQRYPEDPLCEKSLVVRSPK